MATPAAPIKTPLGHDELRKRTRAVGQRLRTILFLVDGRRPLSEVLSLAQQAGAQVCHFEELVRLGLVELPGEAMAPDPVLTAPGGFDTLRVTSVELDLPATAPRPTGAQQTELPFDEIDFVPPRRVEPLEPQPRPVSEPMQATQQPSTAPAPPPSAEVLSALANVAAQAREREALSGFDVHGATHVVSAPRERPVMPAPMARMPSQPRPAQAPPPRVVQREVQAPPFAGAKGASAHRTRTAAPRRAPARAHARARSELSGEPLLQQVRELLVEALRLDSQMYRSRMVARVRVAQTSGDLIELAWEVEKRLGHKRRSRNEMVSLQRARELLGLGNTVVSSDGVLSQH